MEGGFARERYAVHLRYQCNECVFVGSGEGWLLAPMISWIDKNYLKLIRLMPELIEHYIGEWRHHTEKRVILTLSFCALGCDSEGCSQRRFTIVAPTEVAKEVSSNVYIRYK